MHVATMSPRTKSEIWRGSRPASAACRGINSLQPDPPDPVRPERSLALDRAFRAEPLPLRIRDVEQIVIDNLPQRRFTPLRIVRFDHIDGSHMFTAAIEAEPHDAAGTDAILNPDQCALMPIKPSKPSSAMLGAAVRRSTLPLKFTIAIPNG